MKKTKIICTIGPKTESEKKLFELIKNGMNAIRLNFSHGSHEEHSNRIHNLRKICKKKNKKISIILDTKGPEIRTMRLRDGNNIYLKVGQKFSLTTNKSIIGNNSIVAINYDRFIDNLKKDNIIMIDDGLINMKVISIFSDLVVCRVLNSGSLGENKSVNLPGVYTNFPSLSKDDKKDLIFGCRNQVDFIAVSFVKKSKDIIEIRDFLKSNGGEKISIISKIENQEGLNNFEEILKVSDGIMIARGDLGVEIPVEEVVFAQKMMIKKCVLEGKIVITATQMLNSMIENPRPTRAEVSDVANAILDGTDAVMLSGESANGKYPIESIKIMSKICERTDIEVPIFLYKKKNNENIQITESICQGIVKIAKDLKSKLIIAYTDSGKIAKLLRKNFPKATILALTFNEKVEKKLLLFRGVIPKLIKRIDSISKFYQIGKNIALDEKLVQKGDTIIMVSGSLLSSFTKNFFSIHIL
ncbi:pyruvate kinase [Candidatus Riesia sp. GBBU]|nr:pyruvate kinase [Candidatus Riesia sp. GBBU]